jgi:hypothetical protein
MKDFVILCGGDPDEVDNFLRAPPEESSTLTKYTPTFNCKALVKKILRYATHDIRFEY